jgi:serine/threonine-protein kinase
MTLSCSKCGSAVQTPADVFARQTACSTCGQTIELEELMTMAPSTKRGPAQPPAPVPSLDGKRLGGYQLLSLIGRGGMGEVYEAIQESLSRRVAIKVLPSNLTVDPAFVKRFQRESGALAQLSHPHIVSIYDRGQEGEVYYFALEYVEGPDGGPPRTLQDLLSKSGALSPVEAVRLMEQIADALAYAHGKGLVHRDVKPLNVLLDARHNARLVDFGLAHLVGGDPAEQEQLTMAGDVLGTVGYLAPEQRQAGSKVDERADVFACGVVFYQMLTGHLPQGAFEPPSELVPGLGSDWDALIAKALQRTPERRYRNMLEFAEALRAIKGGVAPTASLSSTAALPSTAAPVQPSARDRVAAEVEANVKTGHFRAAL